MRNNIDEFTNAQCRLVNAEANLRELDFQERSKQMRSTEECWRHIQRFSEAMKSVCISDHNVRNLWLDEIDSQLEASRQFLQETK